MNHVESAEKDPIGDLSLQLMGRENDIFEMILKVCHKSL